MSLILKSILNQPLYLESWNLSDFAYFDCEGRNLLIKELINYAIKHKNQNKIPLKEIIMNDRSLSPEQIKSYLNILDDLQYIDGFLNKNEFDNKIKKLNNEKSLNKSKKITKATLDKSKKENNEIGNSINAIIELIKKESKKRKNKTFSQEEI